MLVKILCSTNIHLLTSGTGNSLEVFKASQLAQLNKNPIVRRIGVAKSTTPNIYRKVVMYIAKKDVQDASGSLPVCASQEAGSELSIHATYDIYQQDETEELPF